MYATHDFICWRKPSEPFPAERGGGGQRPCEDGETGWVCRIAQGFRATACDCFTQVHSSSIVRSHERYALRLTDTVHLIARLVSGAATPGEFPVIPSSGPVDGALCCISCVTPGSVRALQAVFRLERSGEAFSKDAAVYPRCNGSLAAIWRSVEG
ncbi:hypothetical protein PAAG_12675 [Paracoccidioides lutzii Pb01]|uniref:Uncharacterized protein n=1 Tax=Paracoccidioides lutzii (strain ATCC MYA-826 / Pb01) TaxID=502779 RepID=A0A0A2V3I7_PARBA|nr:hypothetical protein PAAG_12675 [Paracoccidioides lutzii Pb01]KGQ00665.1 hypothetical protein PAAG_12675 [Paracoccidioides lutzii Pb01]